MQSERQIPGQPIRLWPGVVAVLLQWFLMFVVPLLVPSALTFGMLGGLVGGLAVVAWWAFFSRAPWFDRWTAIGLMVVALAATPRFLHESIATAGMGMLFFIYAIPVLSLAFVAWAVVSRRLSDGARRATMAATILLACGAWALLRTEGVTGDFDSEFRWRWSQTPEQRLLAQAGSTAAVRPSAPVRVGAAAAWPGFRGPDRNGAVPGVRIETDWSASPPVEIWRRPIGPGWSSLAVASDYLYTQEQRGEDEVVACYDLRTGEPVWRHVDAARFWESNAGAGPRATPTLSEGRVFTLGATGIVNALDAADGTVVWSRNAAVDTGASVPDWGFSSSPLAFGDVVIVHAGALVAYDRATGEPRWRGQARAGSYSSPHLATIDGVAQVLQLTDAGVTSVSPADGTVLWEHSWPGAAIVQPAPTADGDVLISTTGAAAGLGTRRLAVAHGPDGWTVTERWISIGLKPYFNDFVVHRGHAYGFDGRILACIELEDGSRRWKGGRYGHGQLLLLPDQDLLLVQSEDGELALVRATPDQYAELARLPAIEGKAWNHPVLAGDVLLVRSDEQMGAFRLSLADRSPGSPHRP